MAKRKIFEVSKNIRYKMLDDFYDMITSIKSRNEAANFIRDILTPSESLMITRRIAIARMLLEGKGYDYIAKKLKVGYNTINNVNRWLYAGFGGYLNEIKKEIDKKQAHKKLPKNEWQKIRKKYPAHFFIFNLMDKIKKRK